MFEQSRNIITFAYALAFFTMGISVLLRVRTPSSFRLAASLRYLGVFGILHGLADWFTLMRPALEGSSDPSAVAILIFSTLLTAASFATLLLFGVEILIASDEGLSRLRIAVSLAVAAWLIVAVGTARAMPVGVLPVQMTYMNSLSRYLFGLPGAILAMVGMLRHAALVQRMGMGQLKSYFHLSAAGMAVYAVGSVGGPPASFFPAYFLNSLTFSEVLGVQPEIIRGLAGIMLAYATLHILEVFDLEMSRRLEAAEKAESLALERERIARDLHDSLIQRLYAAGLSLERAVRRLEGTSAVSAGAENGVSGTEMPEHLTAAGPTRGAEEILDEVKEQLNDTIITARSFITELQSDTSNVSQDAVPLEGELRLMTHELTRTFSTAVNLRVEGTLPLVDNSEASQIRQVVREAVANAVRHGVATRVEVIARNLGPVPSRLSRIEGRVRTRVEDLVVLTIADNGKGFEPEQALADSPGHGLPNMLFRAERLNGKLSVKSAPGKGTQVTLTVPVRRLENGPS